MHQHKDIDVYKYVAYCTTNGLEYIFSDDSLVELRYAIEWWYQDSGFKPMMAEIIDDKIIIDGLRFFVYSKLEDINDKLKEEG
jgi:hypothetical protein